MAIRNKNKSELDFSNERQTNNETTLNRIEVKSYIPGIKITIYFRQLI